MRITSVSYTRPTSVGSMGRYGTVHCCVPCSCPPLHALGDRVLMRAGEGGKHQRAAVRLALIDVHAGDPFVHLADVRQVGELQLRVHALGVHVQRERDDVYVAGAFAVAEQRPLNAVRARQQPHFRIRHGAAAVVVRGGGR